MGWFNLPDGSIDPNSTVQFIQLFSIGAYFSKFLGGGADGCRKVFKFFGFAIIPLVGELGT